MVSRFPFYKPYYRVGAGPEVPTVRPRSVGGHTKVHNYGAVDWHSCPWSGPDVEFALHKKNKGNI